MVINTKSTIDETEDKKLCSINALRNVFYASQVYVHVSKNGHVVDEGFVMAFKSGRLGTLIFLLLTIYLTWSVHVKPIVHLYLNNNEIYVVFLYDTVDPKLQTCNKEILRASDQENILTLPGKGLSLPAHFDCTYTISAPKGKLLHLSVGAFRVSFRSAPALSN